MLYIVSNVYDCYHLSVMQLTNYIILNVFILFMAESLCQYFVIVKSHSLSHPMRISISPAYEVALARLCTGLIMTLCPYILEGR